MIRAGTGDGPPDHSCCRVGSSARQRNLRFSERLGDLRRCAEDISGSFIRVTGAAVLVCYGDDHAIAVGTRVDCYRNSLLIVAVLDSVTGMAVKCDVNTA